MRGQRATPQGWEDSQGEGQQRTGLGWWNGLEVMLWQLAEAGGPGCEATALRPHRLCSDVWFRGHLGGLCRKDMLSFSFLFMQDNSGSFVKVNPGSPVRVRLRERD